MSSPFQKGKKDASGLFEVKKKLNFVARLGFDTITVILMDLYPKIVLQ